MPNDAPGPELRAAYTACRRMQRRHDPTYYWATQRLPREVRPAVHALYGFVRGADELVDGPRRPPDPVARCAVVDAWELELEH
jgi:15-cis-phytoene synthase